MNDEDITATISMILICIDKNPIWRKQRFFKEIYKDEHVYDRKKYREWYKQEYNMFKSLGVEEKIQYIKDNISFDSYNSGFIQEIVKIASIYKTTGSLKETKQIYENGK